MSDAARTGKNTANPQWGGRFTGGPAEIMRATLAREVFKLYQ